MPLYVYQCGACGGQFNSMHSIQVSVTVCSLCGVEDNLSRIPQMISFGKKKSTDDKKVGDVVKEHIEETKEEVAKEKEKLKQEYNP